MSEFLEYVQSIQGQILSLSWEHVELTLFSVILAIAIGVPLGILISYHQKADKAGSGNCQYRSGHTEPCLAWVCNPVPWNRLQAGHFYGYSVFTAANY